jgi:hypothetical protein
MLPRQLFVGVFLYKDGLFKVIHYLQNQNQLFLSPHLHTLQIAPDYLPTTNLQLAHLELPVLIHSLTQQEHAGTHRLQLLVDRCSELTEGLLCIVLLF